MKTKAPLHSGASIELLEPRIAPASLMFNDVDGDMVTVTVSGAATMHDLDHAVHRTASGLGFKITGIALAGHAVFQNADLTVTAAFSDGADGLVHVGGINARGLDLHDVTIDGNLVQIDAGDAKTATPAINQLTAESFGVPAGGTGNAPASFIHGRLTALDITGDVNKAWIRVAGGAKHLADGSIGTISVGGSLRGGSSAHSGSITASGEITSAKIGGDLLGAGGVESGALGTFGKIGTVSVNNITGGTGKHSGAILTKGGLDTVNVNAALTGGSGVESGVVGSLRSIGQVTVADDVGGGSGARSGQIVSRQFIDYVTIGGDLRGGAGAESGAVGSAGGIFQIDVNGSIFGGKRAFTGAILCGGDLVILTVGGAIQTDPTVQAKFTAIITARGFIGELNVGSIAGTATNRVIIAADGAFGVDGKGASSVLSEVSVNGSVAFANILSGYAILPGHTYKNADADIGNVFVGGNWTASTIGAGKLVANRVFGGARGVDTDRALVLRGGLPSVDSTIQSVRIMGAVRADSGSGTISAFIAENIVNLTAASPGIPQLAGGAHNDQEVIFDGGEGRVVGVINEGDVPLT